MKKLKLLKLISLVQALILTAVFFASCGGGEITAKEFIPEEFYNSGIVPFVIEDVSVYFNGVNDKTSYTSEGDGVISGNKFTLPIMTAGEYSVKIKANSAAVLEFSIKAVVPLSAKTDFIVPVQTDGEEYLIPDLSVLFNNAGEISYAPDVVFSADSGTVNGKSWSIKLETGEKVVTFTAQRGSKADVQNKVTINTLPIFEAPYLIAGTEYKISDLSVLFDNAENPIYTENVVYTCDKGAVSGKSWSIVPAAGVTEINITAKREGKPQIVKALSLTAIPELTAKAASFDVVDETEGVEYRINDLSVMFSNSSELEYAPDVVYTANAGTVNGKVWTLTPSIGETTVTVTATRAGFTAEKTFIVTAEPETMFLGFTEKSKTYAGRALELHNTVMKYYFLDIAYFSFHYYPNTGENGDMSTAYLWPYTEQVASAWRVMSIDGRSKKLEKNYRDLLYGFEYYKCIRSDYHVYSAVRATQAGWGSGDTYYDDNIWVAREFLNAYEVLGDDEFLDTALKVCEFIWSGWANDSLGGIYWWEQNKASRNACSNAPAAVLFARLYLETGEAKWLERAKKCYDFVYNSLRRPDGLIWDSVANNGDVNTNEGWIFTYNCGGMITAGVKLFEITGDEKYLSDAKQTAESSYNWFFQSSSRGYKTIKSNNPWFNVLMLDGFIELYHHDATNSLKYIQDYEANLNYAYINLRSTEGLMHNNWVNGGNFNKLNVLDMAANSENFGQLAYFYNFLYKA